MINHYTHVSINTSLFWQEFFNVKTPSNYFAAIFYGFPILN
jgi:hypothetical protein